MAKKRKVKKASRAKNLVRSQTPYQPLHLRYRPKRLGQLVGQKDLVATLRGMLRTKSVPRTFFIFGPYGCGKTTTARLIARYVNCENLNEAGDPCGQCASCLAMDSGDHSDVHEHNCGDKRGIDDIRSLLHTIRFHPQNNYRVFILDEVHQLTPQAAQALLKDTEEPPSKTIFVLCTTEPNRVLRTLVSRAIKLAVHRVPDDVLAKWLSKIFHRATGKEVPKKVFLEVAKAVNGHPRDALTVLEGIVRQSSEGFLGAKDLSESITDLVSDLLPGNPDTYARVILQSIYKGKYTQALDGVRKFHESGGSMVRLTGSCLRFNTEAIYARCSPKLKDRYFADWHGQLKDTVLTVRDGKRIYPVSILVTVETMLIEAQTQLKSYLVDEFYVTLSAVTRAVNMVQGLEILEIE